jgi:hypothetical protein
VPWVARGGRNGVGASWSCHTPAVGTRRRRPEPERIADVVTWHVDPTPKWVLAWGAAKLTFSGVFGLISGGSHTVVWPAELGTPRLGIDDEDALALEAAFLEGSAPWMPAAWAGPQLVECHRDRVTINPTGLAGREVVVPLSSLHLESAHPRREGRRARHATAPWEMRLTGQDTALKLTGPWLTLAWIGHLANWPEPYAEDSAQGTHPEPPSADADPGRQAAKRRTLRRREFVGGVTSTDGHPLAGPVRDSWSSSLVHTVTGSPG